MSHEIHGLATEERNATEVAPAGTAATENRWEGYDLEILQAVLDGQ